MRCDIQRGVTEGHTIELRSKQQSDGDEIVTKSSHPHQQSDGDEIVTKSSHPHQQLLLLLASNCSYHQPVRPTPAFPQTRGQSLSTVHLLHWRRKPVTGEGDPILGVKTNATAVLVSTPRQQLPLLLTSNRSYHQPIGPVMRL